jgi:WD40 repeat protein
MPTVSTLERLSGLTFGGGAVAFSPSGDRLVLAGGDPLDSSRCVREVVCWQLPQAKLWEHKERGRHVQAIAFSPDGQRLLCAEAGPHVTELDTATGQLTRRFVAHPNNSVWGVAYAPDGTRFATASWDMTVKLWQAADAALLFTLADLEESFHSVAFSPDGRYLASASGTTIGVWDVATGRLVHEGRGHGAIAFSPNGEHLVSGGEGTKKKGEILLFQTRDWRRVRATPAHLRACNAVRFSPDGRALATSGDEKAVLLWDVASGKQIAKLQDHVLSEFGVVGLAWSPDGRRLACTDALGFRQPGQVTVYTFADGPW